MRVGGGGFRCKGRVVNAVEKVLECEGGEGGCEACAEGVVGGGGEGCGGGGGLAVSGTDAV